LFFVTPAALGMVFGAITLVRFFHDANKEKVVTLGLFLSGLAMLILPFATLLASKEVVTTINQFLPHMINITNIHIIVMLGFFLGVSNALIIVPCNTILQEETSDTQRGKIYGVLNALVGLFSLIPIILVGSLSDTLGVGNVILGIGVVLLFLTGVRVIID
jgi:sugar phosphate permease